MGKSSIFCMLLIAVLVGMLGIMSGCAQSSSTTTGSTNDVVTTAATDGNTAPAAEKTLIFSAHNFAFDVSGDVGKINKGDKVKVILRSTDGTHGLMINAFGVSVGPVGPGEEKTAEFVADKSGSFDYRCNVPCGSGHMDMNGKLTIN